MRRSWMILTKTSKRGSEKLCGRKPVMSGRRNYERKARVTEYMTGNTLQIEQMMSPLHCGHPSCFSCFCLSAQILEAPCVKSSKVGWMSSDAARLLLHLYFNKTSVSVFNGPVWRLHRWGALILSWRNYTLRFVDSSSSHESWKFSPLFFHSWNGKRKLCLISRGWA